MRLESIKKSKGSSLKHKLMRFLMNLTMDGGAPDIILTFMYRHHFFGKPMGALFEKIMRGESELTTKQRELIAAATSEANECPFCTKMHSSAASLIEEKGNNAKPDFSMDAGELKKQADEPTKKLMDFAGRLAKNEGEVSKEDIIMLNQAGFSKEAITDTIYIVFAFCLINRLANALDFEIPSEKSFKLSGKILLNKGYQI